MTQRRAKKVEQLPLILGTGRALTFKTEPVNQVDMLHGNIQIGLQMREHSRFCGLGTKQHFRNRHEVKIKWIGYADDEHVRCNAATLLLLNMCWI